ncbi:hypothetical protein CYMTET_6329, partial [Cymbomonas tetramitiformis]
REIPSAEVLSGVRGGAGVRSLPEPFDNGASPGPPQARQGSRDPWKRTKRGACGRGSRRKLHRPRRSSGEREHCLSATNHCHEDLGFEGPAKGRAVVRKLKGAKASLQAQELAEAGQEATWRTWLPAEAGQEATWQTWLPAEAVAWVEGRRLVQCCANTMFRFNK